MIKTFIKQLGVLVPCLLILSPGPAPASDLSLEVDIIESYQIQENFLSRDDLRRIDDWHFTNDQAYNLLNLRPLLALNSEKGMWGYVGVDLTWQSDVEDEDGDTVEVDFSTAYLSLKRGKVRVDVGVQAVEFGDAHILADDTLAAVVHADLANGYGEFVAAKVMDHSPMVGVTLGYQPGHYEHVEVFGIWYDDKDDTFAGSIPLDDELLNVESSDGSLYYLGMAADLFLGNTLLTVVAAYQTGWYTISGPLRTIQADVSAYFGDISLQKNLADWCSVGIFCYFASGDDSPSSGDFHSFISILSYHDRASIFFDPDFMDIDDSEQFILSGGHTGGTIAPGLNLTLASDWGLIAEFALIYLYADQALSDGSQWYGWEADLDINFTLRDRYKFFLEAARFEHGDYYESLLNESLDAATRLSAGLRVIF